MNKIQFNTLKLKEQIQYFNERIKDIGNNAKVCKELDINESTIRTRFNKHGYKLNKEKTAYIYFDNTIVNKNKFNNSIAKPNKNNHNNAMVKKENRTNEYSKSANNHSNIMANHPNNEIDNHDITEVIKEIKDIISIKDDILKIVKLYNEGKLVFNNKHIQIDKNRIKDTKGVTKAIKIYPGILDEFKGFCNKYSEFKIMDLLSMAMIEYMDKYDK